VTCSPAATTSNLVNDATCLWDNAAGATTYTTTLSGTAGGNILVPTAQVCSVPIGSVGCDGANPIDEDPVLDNVADTGLLTMSAPVTVTSALHPRRWRDLRERRDGREQRRV